MKQISYQRLDVYQCAMLFLEQVVVLGRQFPRGYADLGDQLRRASSSISLNIAEGAGKSGLMDRRRFYEIARGLAFECSAVLDCCTKLSFFNGSDLENARHTIYRIIQMLSKMTSPKR